MGYSRDKLEENRKKKKLLEQVFQQNPIQQTAQKLNDAAQSIKPKTNTTTQTAAKSSGSAAKTNTVTQSAPKQQTGLSSLQALNNVAKTVQSVGESVLKSSNDLRNLQRNSVLWHGTTDAETRQSLNQQNNAIRQRLGLSFDPSTGVTFDSKTGVNYSLPTQMLMNASAGQRSNTSAQFAANQLPKGMAEQFAAIRNPEEEKSIGERVLETIDASTKRVRAGLDNWFATGNIAADEEAEQKFLAGEALGWLDRLRMKERWGENWESYLSSVRDAYQSGDTAIIEEYEQKAKAFNSMYDTTPLFDEAAQQAEEAKAGLGKAGRTALDALGMGADMLGAASIASTGGGGAGLFTGISSVNAAGQAADQARRMGASTAQQEDYGNAVGALNFAVERLGGIGGGEAAAKIANRILPEAVQNAAGKATSTAVGRVLAGGAEEGLEGAIQSEGERALRNAMLGANEAFDPSAFGADVGYSALMGSVYRGGQEAAGAVRDKSISALTIQTANSQALGRRLAELDAEKRQAETLLPGPIRDRAIQQAEEAMQRVQQEAAAKNPAPPARTEPSVQVPADAAFQYGLSPEAAMLEARERARNEAIKAAQQNSVGAAEYNFDPYSRMTNEYGTIDQGEKPRAREVDVPKSTDGEDRVSLFARTAMEAGATPDEAIERFEQEVANGTFSHDVRKDKDSVNKARQTITEKGFDGAMEQWADVTSGRRSATKDDIVLAEILYAKAMQTGEIDTGMRLAAEIAAEGTRAGQSVQAIRLLKRTTPEGKLYYIKKTVDNVQKDLEKKYGDKAPKIEINEQLALDLLTAQTDQDANAAMDAIYNDVAAKIPATIGDRLNAWRYFAMLGNPRTHIRNVIGNIVYQIPSRASNKLSAGLQKIFIKDENRRTRSLLRNGKIKEFAKQDYQTMQDVLDGNQYTSEMSEIQRRKKTFPKPIQAVMDANSKALDWEDQVFKRMTYVNSMTEFLTARRVDVDNIPQDTLEQARTHAINDARRATFQDASALADFIGKIEKKNKASEIKAYGDELDEDRATTEATEFSRYLDMKQYDSAKRAALEDTFKFYNMFPAEAQNYTFEMLSKNGSKDEQANVGAIQNSGVTAAQYLTIKTLAGEAEYEKGVSGAKLAAQAAIVAQNTQNYDQYAAIMHALGYKKIEDAYTGAGTLPAVTESGSQISRQVESAAGFINPTTATRSKIVSWYGNREQPDTTYGEGSKFHEGVDIGGPDGQNLDGEIANSIGNGTVVDVGYDQYGYGNYVVVDYGNGYQALYGHLRQASVSTGQKVNAGEEIGIIGGTGNVEGPHLHLKMTKDGQNIDPLTVIPGYGTERPATTTNTGQSYAASSSRGGKSSGSSSKKTTSTKLQDFDKQDKLDSLLKLWS